MEAVLSKWFKKLSPKKRIRVIPVLKACLAKMDQTTLVNVKVKYIRPQGHDNFKEWSEDINNVYIGRGTRVPIKPKIGDKYTLGIKQSKWSNPFKVKSEGRLGCIELYRNYIVQKIKEDPTKYNLEELRGKTLGCWCHPEPCHGDVLLSLLNNN